MSRGKLARVDFFVNEGARECAIFGELTHPHHAILKNFCFGHPGLHICLYWMTLLHYGLYSGRVYLASFLHNLIPSPMASLVIVALESSFTWGITSSTNKTKSPLYTLSLL